MVDFDISKPIEERVDPGLITDYSIQRFSITGTSKECVARIRRLEEAGVRRVMLAPTQHHFRFSDGILGTPGDYSLSKKS